MRFNALPSDRVLAIEAAIAAGLSTAAIVRKLNCSKQTVLEIKSGRYDPIGRLSDRDADGQAPPYHDPNRPKGPRQRCPGCRGMVYLPCYLCWLRGRKTPAKTEGRMKEE